MTPVPLPRPTPSAILCLWAALALTGAARPLTASAEDTAMVRVRSDNPTIVRLIQEARDRSATFRALLRTIDDSDGIVYIEDGTCGHGVRACLIHSVTLAGSNRVLRVRLGVRGKERDMMASLGHELRHVVEVLSDRSVTSGTAMYFLYARQGEGAQNRYETEAATEAGFAVYMEVQGTRSAARAR